MTDLELFDRLKDRKSIKKIIKKFSYEKTESLPSYRDDFMQMMHLELWELSQYLWFQKGVRTLEDLDNNIKYITFCLRRRSYDVYKELIAPAKERTLNKALELPYHNPKHSYQIIDEEQEELSQSEIDLASFAFSKYQKSKLPKEQLLDFGLFLFYKVDDKRELKIGKLKILGLKDSDIASEIKLSHRQTNRITKKLREEFNNYYKED